MLPWLVLSLTAPTTALACGPYFSTAMLTRSDEDLWSSPLVGFADELSALYPPNGEGPTYQSQTTLGADEADLTAAMGAAAPIDAVRALRQRTHPGYYDSPQSVTEADIPPGLPAEFDLYLRGAVAWHSNDVPGAIAQWQAVLALPPTQRQYRSTWAAFMLGRATADPAWLERTRALAAEGFTDSLGLAEASYGWEAHDLFWNQQALHQAAELYIRQIRASDPDAAQSLRIVADSILGEGGDLETAARDPELARIVTLRLLSLGDTSRAGAWLDAVEQGGTTGVVGAEQLAWASYQAGDMDRTRRWLDKADESAMTHWIRARLAMRDGDMAAAETHLAAAAEQFGPSTAWHVSWRNDEIYDALNPAHQALAERGAVLVQQGRYADALLAFLRADHTLDAAYIAERVLSLDELRAAVDASIPEDDRPAHQLVRNLLARRLLRERPSAEALPYFSAELREPARAYIDALERARDPKSTRLVRAQSLWVAAQRARWDGLEILGTELDPDYAHEGGYFEAPSVELARTGWLDGQKFGPTPEERHRLEQHTSPEQRFHYRYHAAQLAGEAAALLPDDDTGTLKVLCQAGSWLKYRDPQAADPYYKAMVNRGWNNSLGTLANDLRWFPPEADCAMTELTLDHPEKVVDSGCSTAAAPAQGRLLLGGLGALLALGARRRRRA